MAAERKKSMDSGLRGNALSALKEACMLSSLPIDECSSKLGSASEGLDPDRVLASRERHGVNRNASLKRKSVPERLFASFVTPFTLLLFAVAAITAVVELLSDSGDPTWWLTPLIIIVMVMISGLVSFVENGRSERSSDALRHYTENTSTVIREGKPVEVGNGEIVYGDLVRLGAGDMLPADCRIVAAKDLFLDQSALNGESTPSEKNGDAFNGESSSLFDFPNLAYAGSSVVSGTGLAIVFAVGDKTVLGRLSKKAGGKREKTAFEKGLSSIARLLMGLMSVMVPAVFLLRGLCVNFLGDLGAWKAEVGSWENWLTALTFAISVAVGLTPALLPMQVASNLARGAQDMAKRKVIVKDINSIQNFGAMDVLCTDKTGTLTEGNSTLSDCLDFNEKPNGEILGLAYLNSRFQTGIRNQLDRSIVDYLETKPDDVSRLLERYERLDEIPFDFNRKMLSVLISDRLNGKRILICKGFPGTLKDRIGFVKDNDAVRPATKDDIVRIKETADRHASLGKRVILVAEREIDSSSISVSDEADLVFLGYVSFKDAPKPTAAHAIAELRRKGVRAKVLTGDSLAGSLALLEATGFGKVESISGPKIALLDDDELRKEVERCDLFVKLSPEDKERIVLALKANGHVVGFMGDGINDVAALRAADVGISFKEATDIAKEAADMIMLENDLGVLSAGIDEGRKAYINMMKYLKGQTSSDFGNMLSQLIASMWIPFIPMLPVQLILLGMVSDVSCACMPFDKADAHMIEKPVRFDVKEIRDFVFCFGPLSSIVDLATFALLLYFVAPGALLDGSPIGNYSAAWLASPEGSIEAAKLAAFTAIFQTGFFLESLVTQNVVYLFLRTDRLPLVVSRPSLTFGFSIALSVLLGFFFVYVPDVQSVFSFAPNPDLPWVFLPCLVAILAVYLALTQLGKRIYKKKFGKLL